MCKLVPVTASTIVISQSQIDVTSIPKRSIESSEEAQIFS